MSEPQQLPLVFDEPRGRKKPPRHLADLDEAGRTDLLASLGLPGFRAKQLSTHYFGRLVDDCGLDRSTIAVAAISEAAAAAAGFGWQTRAAAGHPEDEALLELAVKLCKTEGEKGWAPDMGTDV